MVADTCFNKLKGKANTIFLCLFLISSYGINAGVIAAPDGCVVTTEDDGCTVKIVQQDNQNEPCSF